MDTWMILVIIAACYLVSSYAIFTLFKKGEVKKYLAFIPIINIIYLLKMVDMKWFHVFEFLISIGVSLLCYFNNFWN